MMCMKKSIIINTAIFHTETRIVSFDFMVTTQDLKSCWTQNFAHLDLWIFCHSSLQILSSSVVWGKSVDRDVCASASHGGADWSAVQG